MIRNLLAAATLALVLPVTAAAAERNMSYNFVEFGFANLDFAAEPYADSGEELSVDGLRLETGYEISDFAFLVADYDDFGGDGNVSTRRRSFGAGLAFGLGDRTDFYLKAAHVRIALTHLQVDDNGVEAELGLRRMLFSRSELFASAGYSSIFDDSDTRFTVGSRYWFSDGFAVSLALQESGLAGAGFILSGRFNF